MSLTTVQGREVDPSQQPLAGVRVSARLVTAGGAFLVANPASQITSFVDTTTDSDGNWSLQLTPQAEITPDGTYYLVHATTPTGAIDHNIDVAVSASPLSVLDCLIDPSLLTPAPLGGLPPVITSVPVSGPLTDDELRATPVPVAVSNPTAATDVSALAKDNTLAQVVSALAAALQVTVTNPTANPETGLAKDANLTTLLGTLTTAVAALQASVDAQAQRDYERDLRFPTRALQYARDSTDRMYVNTNGTTVSTVWGNNNSYPTWYSTGAAGSVDAREQQRELSQQTFIAVRNDRWVIT